MAMTVKTESGVPASAATRASGKGSVRAGMVEQLTRADRVAQGKDARAAHARSGDRIALAAYLGGSSAFDQAIADFAETYGDQNERDYAALQAAVKDGRAEAATEI